MIYSVKRENFLVALVLFLICLFQSDDRGSLTLSLCQQPTAGHLHVIVMKATGLPPPKSDAPGGLGKCFFIASLCYFHTFHYPAKMVCLNKRPVWSIQRSESDSSH